MPVGPVNRALLESNFQNPGDIYLDTKTEGGFDVLADQIDENAGIFGANGSSLITSATIPGVTGTNVYDQLAFMESQIQANTNEVVAPGTISTALLQNSSVTHVKLSAAERTASVGGRLYAYQVCFGV